MTIGASPRRKDDDRLLGGSARFLDDVAAAGVLHLGVVRSRHAHARIAKVETSDAMALPGVIAAWRAGELTDASRPLAARHGSKSGARPYTQPVLAGEVARFVGEPLAVVVAADAYVLADALDAVQVTYEPLPAVATIDDALANTTRLHEGWPDNAGVVARGAAGDVAAGFAEADVVVQERLRHPRLSGNAIEPRGVLAHLDDVTGHLVVWSSTQNPYSVRDVVAAVLDLPVEEVRVLVPQVGGGFGPKGAVYAEEVLVAAAARRLRRPVKWVESRREHLASTGHDRDQRHQTRIGFRADGTIAAIENEFHADVGAYPAQGDGLTLNTVNHLPGPYRVRHYRAVGTSVVTNKALNAAYRAAGRPEAVFVMERLMDIGARKLGLDPAEIRRRNLVRPTEMPYRSGLTYKDGVSITYDPGDLPSAFERALRLLDYEGFRAKQRARAGSPQRIGIGLACYVQGTGLGPFEGATVRVDSSGKVRVVIGVTAQGQGHGTTLAQICAGELGVPFEDVTVVTGDTGTFPYGMGTGGSRVMANAGPAVAQTAREVRGKATRVAAELLECAPEDIRIEGGQVHVAGVPSRAVPLGRVAHAALRSKSLKAMGEPGLNSCTFFYPDTVTWAFGTHATAVEVDVETCEVRMLAYVVVHDSGRAINPTIVEGQLQGGAVQGIGAGLMEEVVYGEDAQLLSGTFMDYAMPRADSVPAIVVERADHPSMINDLGVKGVGESGSIAPAAAIANAVEDALADMGVVIREVPVTPARLFESLQAARR